MRTLPLNYARTLERGPVGPRSQFNQFDPYFQATMPFPVASTVKS